MLVLETFCSFCSNMIAISGGNLNIMRILNLFMHFHLLRTLTLIQKSAPDSTVPYEYTKFLCAPQHTPPYAPIPETWTDYKTSQNQ